MFKDKRGIITDLIVTPDYSITHITFTVGAVRGNHFHKETTQKDFILKGELEYAQDDERGKVRQGETLEHKPGVKHSYRAIRPSEMISICWGVRKGEDYEKDTYRLDKPML